MSALAQFGYRFSLDVQVFLFVILATVFERGMSRLAWLAGRRVDRHLRLRDLGDLDRLRGLLARRSHDRGDPGVESKAAYEHRSERTPRCVSETRSGANAASGVRAPR